MTGTEQVNKGLPWDVNQTGSEPVTSETLQQINQASSDKSAQAAPKIVKTSTTVGNGYIYFSTIYRNSELATNLISPGKIQTSAKKRGKGKKVQEQPRQFLTVFPHGNDSNKPNIGTQDQSVKGKYQYHDS